MKVKATKKCFRGGRLRQPGEVFDDQAKSAKDLPKWLEPVKETKTAEAKKDEE